jgi:hypothetical protein
MGIKQQAVRGGPKAEIARDFSVTLKWPGGDVKRIDYAKDDRPERTLRINSGCLAWSYLVLRRSRWNSSKRALADLGERAKAALGRLGLEEDDLEKIAKGRVVEVSIPYYTEDDGWWWRILPWEFLLSSATRKLGRTKTLTVIRRLERRGDGTAAASNNKKVAVVISKPLPIAEGYNFEGEEALVEHSLTSYESVKVETPTLKDLGQAVTGEEPAVIHVGGFDSHQGQTRMLEEEHTSLRDKSPLQDGMVLKDDRGRPVAVSHEKLVPVLVGAARKPSLVALNIYRSNRIAAQCVGEGATTAIGFQDTFDDLAAEIFFAEFYRVWQKSKNPLTAFELAWDALAGYPRPLEGTGITIWSADSLMPSTVDEYERVLEGLRAERAKRRADDPLVPAATACQELKVDCVPLKEINYSLLHNRQPLYSRFKLTNPKARRTPDVTVNLELLAGLEPIRCEASIAVTPHSQSIAERLFLPLTSRTMRGLREKIRATLRTSVGIGRSRIGSPRTDQVTLLPVNEWVDSDAQRQWLPSFVYPLDPAIARIISKAQRHLRAQSDSWSVGFDGYQSFDPDAEDPSAPIDEQVAAIWNTLVQDFEIAYINPPPTYTDLSQRLRTPSDVTEGRRGTCIDLALLLAACWEYVGLYPVIFLLSGHAFPGYWRSEDAWSRFVNMEDVSEMVDLGQRSAKNSDRVQKNFEVLFDELDDFPERESWMFGRADQRRILDAVKRGDLVPVESTWLATNGVFPEALDAGYENLRPREEFEWLIEVTMAREADVTPLPLDLGEA